MQYKGVAIFDLDGTVIDSSHRTPNNPDGTLNLRAYFANKTRESVMADSLLPLADTMRNLFTKNYFIIICTARDMNKDDYDFLEKHNLNSHIRLNRNKQREFIDDFTLTGLHLQQKLDSGEIKVNSNYKKPDAEYKYNSLLPYLFNPDLVELPKHFFDDSVPILQKFRKLSEHFNLTMYNAHSINKRIR